MPVFRQPVSLTPVYSGTFIVILLNVAPQSSANTPIWAPSIECLILHHRAGADRGVRIRHPAEVQRHAEILIPDEVVGPVFIDGVITLTVVVRVVQIIDLQHPVVRYEGHRIAHIRPLGRGEKLVVDGFIRFIRQSAGAAAAGKQKSRKQQD